MRMLFPSRWFLLAGAAASLQAGVAILGVPEPPRGVTSLQWIALRVRLDADDGKPHDWQWKIIQGPHGWQFDPPSGPATRFRALVVEREAFVVEVRDRLAPDLFAQVTIPVETDATLDQIFASLEAVDPGEGLVPPALEPLVGEFGGSEASAARHFRGIKLVRALNDPAMARLGQGLLVLDEDGVALVDRRLAVTRVLRAGDIRAQDGWVYWRSREEPERFGPLSFEITAMAVLPPGARADAPWRVVLACWDKGWHYSYLFALQPDGSLVQIAGGWELSHDGSHEQGPAKSDAKYRGYNGGIGFGRIPCMTLDAAGNLTLVDVGARLIRRISAAGDVRTLLRENLGPPSHPGAAPGDWDGSLGSVDAITEDPATGNLYLAGGWNLYRVDVHRQATKIVGEFNFGFMPEREPPGTRRAVLQPHDNVLGRPRDLVWHGGKLWFPDTNNNCVRSFDPATSTIENLCGAPGQNQLRFGQAQPSEGKPQSECAAIPGPLTLCPGPEGALVVGVGNALLELRRVVPRPPRPGPSAAKAELPEDKQSVWLNDPIPEPPGRGWEADFWGKAKAAPPQRVPSGHESKEAPSGAASAGTPTLYLVPGIPAAASPLAQLTADGTPTPGGAVGLTVQTTAGGSPAATWDANAGTVENLGGGRARFTVPANAMSGSVFRVTARSVSAFSNSLVFEIAIDLRVP